MLALRDSLRSGDVFVPGSRRYDDPASYLLTPEQWGPQRAEFCTLVERPPDPTEAWPAAESELELALGDLDAVLAKGDGQVRLTRGGRARHLATFC